MKGSNILHSPRLITLLLLNRIVFLRPREKYHLALHYASKVEGASAKIMAKTIEQWRQLLGRQVRASSWTEETKLRIRQGLRADLVWLSSRKGSVCTIDNSLYPHLLRHIPDPPIVLFALGSNLSILQSRNVSIVGTRKPNREGVKYSFAMGSYLARMGINVVSGFAYGIDISAHKGVLHAHGQTMQDKAVDSLGKPIVVLGTSIDKIYPKLHIAMAKQVLQQGGVILSEFSPSSDTHKTNFIGRNRIISGLSMDSVVIQAPKKSGALATADFALEQGRNLWVHRAGLSVEFEGSLALLEGGAARILDVGEELLQ